MKPKQYHLFNPDTGRHTVFNTLAEAQAERERLLRIKMEDLKKFYGILEETFYENGDSETRPVHESFNQPASSEVGFYAGHPVAELRDRHPLFKKVEIL